MSNCQTSSKKKHDETEQSRKINNETLTKATTTLSLNVDQKVKNPILKLINLPHFVASV
jgi:hypothetical protein